MPFCRDRAVQPDVSIVIPVFNKLELTQGCLASLHREPTAATFEIIVVDNGSSDGSREWLAAEEQAGRLRAINNPENLGFSRGCNVGAAAARGRYILFLNNDMEVTPHWLDPMVTTLDDDPDAGIAGARLLFADDTIQHGGVALIEAEKDGWRFIGGLHMSYQMPADYPGTQTAQLMQIVTGACLLIRPGIFAAAGGFDEGFWNGNEDVDLCLKAGEMGWQVVYRGESLVYHYESQSGHERFAQVQANVKRFNDIWYGRARPDFVKGDDRKFNPTPDNAIRPYAAPRVLFNDRRGPADGARAGDPRASVVVLTWNALDYTKRCAASLLEHTDPRHELIFVDNASTDGTREYLADLARSQPRVRLILNDENLGFAAGNNIGIAASRGDYVCLLNSDTVVTDGWLDRLMAPMERDPRIGLTGPVTNSITGVQKLPAVDYDEQTLEGLDAFAARRAAEHAGRTDAALWIVGYCLCIRKRLVESLGGLDEIYGQGNFEDTDYCLRAFLAGYRAEIVHDAFVHHFGSRSFVAGGVDYAAQMDEKFEIFRTKWNLPENVRETGDFNLTQIILGGAVGARHFEPLPPSDNVTRLPLPAWEAAAWTVCGEESFQKGNLFEAEKMFRAVLALAPHDSRAGNDLACTLWQGDPDGEGGAEARRIIEGILAREPENEDARWNLAEMTGAHEEEAAHV